MELAREFDRGFRGFGTARGEVDSAICEIRRSEREKPLGEFLCRFGMKLRGVSKCDLRSLPCHSFCDFLDAVADVDDGSLARCVEIFFTVGGDDPGTFTPYRGGERFLKVTWKKCRRVCGHGEGDCNRRRKR